MFSAVANVGIRGWLPWALLAVGVVAASAGAILVRYAESAGPLAIAFWRCAAGAAVLAPFAAPRLRVRGWTAGRWPLVAGAFLALHFATWITSLGLTTVAAAVLLVSTTPVFVALARWVWGRWAPGRPPQPPNNGGSSATAMPSGNHSSAPAARMAARPSSRRPTLPPDSPQDWGAGGAAAPWRGWAGIGLAVAGSGLVAGGDLGGSALAGNALALLGGASAAGYVLAGQRARRGLGIAEYAAATYAVAAVLLGVACLLGQVPLGGYPAGTWWALAGMVAGPQLLGHTVINLVLKHLDATAVATVLLAEPLVATALAYALFGEVPAALVVPGGAAVLLGIALVVRARAAAP
jgi:drug/metabolite transporter (DMT)-like permease